MKCAFADTRIRYTKVTPAPARGPIQNQKDPTASGVSAEHLKRKKLLTPLATNRRLMRLNGQLSVFVGV